MRTLTNEELMRALGVTLIPASDHEIEIATEILARLIDGRAVLCEPGEELSGVDTKRPCCGEEFRALANGNTAY